MFLRRSIEALSIDCLGIVIARIFLTSFRRVWLDGLAGRSESYSANSHAEAIVLMMIPSVRLYFALISQLRTFLVSSRLVMFSSVRQEQGSSKSFFTTGLAWFFIHMADCPAVSAVD